MYRHSHLFAAITICSYLFITGCLYSTSRDSTPPNIFLRASEVSDTQKTVHSETEWKAILSSEQFSILRGKENERPYTGKYIDFREKGIYCCAACGNELFSSEMKYDAECGWPSFDNELKGGKTITAVDTSFEMVRTELMCRQCGSHLGHLFYDGPTETGLHYCVNSISLEFKRPVTASAGN